MISNGFQEIKFVVQQQLQKNIHVFHHLSLVSQPVISLSPFSFCSHHLPYRKQVHAGDSPSRQNSPIGC